MREREGGKRGRGITERQNEKLKMFLIHQSEMGSVALLVYMPLCPWE